MRALRFMEPWNTSTECEGEKPVQKFVMAGAESVPPAPWVKIKMGGGEVEAVGEA